MLKVAVELPGEFDAAGEWLADARAMDSAGADTLVLGAGALNRQALLGALAAVTQRSRIVAEDASGAVQALARGRVIGLGAEVWRRIPEPESREHWIRLHDEAERSGATGVLVAHGPRILDLLRNPDVVEDRSDLQLAQG